MVKMGRFDSSTRNFVYGFGTGIILLNMLTGNSGVAFVTAVAGTTFGWYDCRIDQDVARFLNRYVKI